MISPAISLPAAQAARSLSPPARPPQLALYISPTYYFAYMEEREGKERECVLSLLQKLAYSSVWNPPPKISLAKVWRFFLAS